LLYFLVLWAIFTRNLENIRLSNSLILRQSMSWLMTWLSNKIKLNEWENQNFWTRQRSKAVTYYFDSIARAIFLSFISRNTKALFINQRSASRQISSRSEKYQWDITQYRQFFYYETRSTKQSCMSRQWTILNFVIKNSNIFSKNMKDERFRFYRHLDIDEWFHKTRVQL
jgi:hypothetical protein